MLLTLLLLQALEVRKIWNEAPHNAFTDLIRFQDRWFCVFREGSGHVSPDGALRVITSSDGERWTSAALLKDPAMDLRDAKINVTPDGKLMLGGAGARNPDRKPHQSLTWFSDDGARWSEATPVGDPDVWLWRVTWHRDVAYGIGYGTAGGKFIRLYSSRDGRKFETLVEDLHHEGFPNESSILFREDGTALCLLRRDEKPSTALLGTAKPPYREWTWKDLGKRIGGPHLIALPDGRIVAAGRLYDGATRTSLLWLDPTAGTLTEFQKLPSGGDTSYPGLVLHGDRLWVSYYSSHEGKTAVYLAKVKVP